MTYQVKVANHLSEYMKCVAEFAAETAHESAGSDANDPDTAGSQAESAAKTADKLAADSGSSDESSWRSLQPEVVWFRGQGNPRHSLVPSLYRRDVRAERTHNGSFTRLHYAEDIRTQHYIARNSHLLSRQPVSRVEWLEVMQHHLTYTRLLDWSESSLHSLLFALEPFFDKNKYDDFCRRECLPCVWLLKPGKLNQKILDGVAKDRSLQENLFSDLNLNEREQDIILTNLKRYQYKSGTRKQSDTTKDTRHIDYILNLSSINDEILRNRGRLKELLIAGEVINPYYYLLSRIYSDGYLLTDRKLPPLCVVQPYHSERIRAQKGVFTVFPFYQEDGTINSSMRKIGINPDAMERNQLAEDCLCQIIIQNPQEVALELMKNGANISWLYPEMPVVSSEIENHQIF